MKVSGLPGLFKLVTKQELLGGLVAVITIAVGTFMYQNAMNSSRVHILAAQNDKINKSYTDLKNQDQYKINQQLKVDLKNTHDNYTNTISLYEKIVDLKAEKQDTSDLDKLYASIVKELSDLKYSSAEGDLKDLSGKIDKINADLAAKAAANPARSE